MLSDIHPCVCVYSLSNKPVYGDAEGVCRITGEKIKALPVIEFDELNKAVGFTANQSVCNDNGFAFIKTVGMQWRKDFILMETAEGTEYTPLPDVIEILGSEYDELSKRIKE